MSLDNSDFLHPTAQKLVDTVITMLETIPYTKIKSEIVLMRSGISRGPLYHHFQDFNDLISAAHTQIYRGTADAFTRELYQGVNSANNAAEALTAFMNCLKTLAETDSTSQRRVLLGVLHDAMSSPELRDEIVAIQEAVNNRWIKIHQLCKSRGWSSDKSEGRVVAIIMEAALFGSNLDDFSSDGKEREHWEQTLSELFEYFFLENGS